MSNSDDSMGSKSPSGLHFDEFGNLLRPGTSSSSTPTRSGGEGNETPRDEKHGKENTPPQPPPCGRCRSLLCPSLTGGQCTNSVLSKLKKIPLPIRPSTEYNPSVLPEDLKVLDNDVEYFEGKLGYCPKPTDLRTVKTRVTSFVQRCEDLKHTYECQLEAMTLQNANDIMKLPLLRGHTNAKKLHRLASVVGGASRVTCFHYHFPLSFHHLLFILMLG